MKGSEENRKVQYILNRKRPILVELIKNLNDTKMKYDKLMVNREIYDSNYFKEKNEEKIKGKKR